MTQQSPSTQPVASRIPKVAASAAICATLLGVIPAIMLGVSVQSAQAETRPSAGSLLREAAQPTSSLRQKADQLSLNGRRDDPSIGRSVAPGGATVAIRTLRIHGNSVFTEAALLTVLGHKAGARYDMAGLLALADRITAHYRQAGYSFARAYLPRQEVTGGGLKITVLEGRYGAVETSGEKNLAGPAASFLKTLKPGDVIAQNPLERATLVLGDLSGITAFPVLRPGSARGTADLNVAVTRDKRWDGSFSADNHGNRFAGSNRGRIKLALNGFVGFGDRLSMALLRSDKGMTLGEIGYGFAVTGSGLRAETKLSRYSYALEDSFEGFEGTAETASVALHYPLKRSVKTNVTASIEGKYDRLSDTLNGARVDKKTAKAGTARLQFDHRDNWLGAGQTFGSAGLQMGDITSSEASTVQGSFRKLELSLARLQALPNGFEALVSANLQHSPDPLNGAQQISLGGATKVRAYPAGEANATSGAILQTELRYARGAYAPFVFYDAGTIKADGQEPARSLSGYGVGLRMTQGPLQAAISIAWNGAGGAAQSDERQSDPTIWANISYAF